MNEVLQRLKMLSETPKTNNKIDKMRKNVVKLFHLLKITALHVSRDAVIPPKTFKKFVCCEQAIIIGSERRILIGNRYQWHSWKILMSSKWVCNISKALQTTSNGIIDVIVKIHNFKITGVFSSDFVWNENEHNFKKKIVNNNVMYE